MARGGFRPGAGRPRKGEPQAPKVASEGDANEPRDDLDGKTPLEYMLSVMNDRGADEARRDKMAMAAAPYVHSRAADAAPGKKEQRQEAAEKIASAGKFAPRGGPKLAVNNG